MQYRVTKPKDPEKSMEVWVYGVDFGKTPILWQKNREYLVLKIPGGSGWASRGTSKYYATYFQVCKILSQTDDEWTVEEVIAVPLRASSERF
jgi:hypothetical protein